MSWWSNFWDWITGGIGAIIAAVAIIAVTAVANVFTGGALTSVLVGEIFGAIGGAAGAAATGGDIGRGMLIGTVVGGITGGILGPPGSAGGGFIQAGVGETATWSISTVGSNVANIAVQSIITSGVGAGASITSGWIASATNRDSIASSYEQKIRALRTDSLTRPDKIKVPVSSRYLAPGSFGPKHSFIGGANPPWEMGPYNGKIATSNTIGDLSNWGTHVATARAISSGSVSSITVEVSASGLKKAMAIYGQAWEGQSYIATNHNSNYAVKSVIYGAGGDISGDLGWTPGFPDQP